MEDEIRKKLEAFRNARLSEEERFARKLQRSKEQQQLFKLIAEQAIDPAFKEYLRICRDHRITCAFEHFYQHAYSVFCLDKRTIPRPGEGGLWAPSLVIRFHYADWDEAQSEVRRDESDAYDIHAINIDKYFFRRKRFRGKKLVRWLDRGTGVEFLRSHNFSELNKELVIETLKIFIEAYLDLRLRR